MSNILFIKNLPFGYVLLFACSQLLVCCIMLCLSERCLKILPFLWRVTTPYNTSDDRHDHWSFSQQYQQGWQSTSFILNGTYAFSFFSVDNEQNDGKPLWPNDIVISWNGQSDHLQYKKMWITITRRNNKTKNAGCFMRRRSWIHTTSSKRLITSLCKKITKNMQWMTRVDQILFRLSISCLLIKEVFWQKEPSIDKNVCVCPLLQVLYLKQLWLHDTLLLSHVICYVIPSWEDFLFIESHWIDIHVSLAWSLLIFCPWWKV